ncbi:hypothetical protein GRF29_77g1475359 [Pseudopithomyces chartarum]|uniref:Transmembrane protein n=1 Tax=Pseudopithomyces chartarum TaxID=1892770 RepID=A0AAN6LWA8_9PLEO|nr:hypothetical protein GRF29_77g1475359 [Pseudopithomyces chartarum]
MATKSDIQVAALAAGFTIGFGFLTVWEAMKQTSRNRNPLRSLYIFMVWGEIIANVILGVLAWLFLDGTIPAGVPTFFFILLCWVFEIQFLMQIIVNRISLIAENQKTVKKIKWGTMIIISCINICVFCVFIPAHLDPPASQLAVDINKYWDRASKILIMIVDASLNIYFIKTVRSRLLKRSGLHKYKPLAAFNEKMMAVSVCMDLLLIGLMWLPNQVVFIQFHPVVYIVKLNIEMSMASLVVRLAQGKSDVNFRDMYDPESDPRSMRLSNRDMPRSVPLSVASIRKADKEDELDDNSMDGMQGIHCRTDLAVTVENVEVKGLGDEHSSKGSDGTIRDIFGDEMPLNKEDYRIQETPNSN